MKLVTFKNFRKNKKVSALKKPKHVAVDLKNHPLVVPIITFMVMFFISLAGFVSLNGRTVGASDSRIVQVTIDGKEQILPSRAGTVGELLERMDVTIAEKDIVIPAVTTQILEDNFQVTVHKARDVAIEVDGERKVTTFSAEPSAAGLAENAGFKVYPEDRVEKNIEPIETANIRRNGLVTERVVITRATPTMINLYGNNIPVRTHATTVGDVLKEKNIKTVEGDTLKPGLDTVITDNMQIFVIRLGKQIDTKEEVIPAPVETVTDASLAQGTSAVRKEGSPGKKLVTYEVELENNKEISRKVIQEVLVSEPVKRVMAKGSKVIVTVTGSKVDWLIAAGVSPSDYSAADYIISRESGWCPTKWQGERGGCPAYHGAPTSPSVGYGLCQSTPASKMATAGADWASNPVTQLRWCSNYANRYGGWQGAYQFWVTNHWW